MATTSPDVARKLDDALAELLASDAPLGKRLATYADELRVLNQPFAEAVDHLVERLMAVEAGAHAPQLGDVLPEFQLPCDDGRLVSLADLLEAGPQIVAFRRGHWCPYCLLATNALARIETAARSHGAGLVVISPEKVRFTRDLKQHTGASFPVLSDIDNGYALSLGLAISVGEEMREFMRGRGRDLATYHGNDAWMLPIPATFVLDRHGRIVMRHVDPDYRRRATIDDIMAAVRRLSA